MLDYIKKYIEDNLKNIFLLFSIIIIGIIFGIIFYQFVPSGTKEQLINTLRITLNSCKQEDFESVNVIKNGIISNCILIVLVYASALTLIAPTCICMINALKAFSIGLYIPTLFQVFGFGNGILALLFLVIIPNIIYIPAFIYLSANSINFHFSLIGSNENRFKLIFSESFKLILASSIIVLSVIIEQLLSLGVIRIYINM